VKGEALNFREEMYDYKAGESFMLLHASDRDGNPVGSIRYSILGKTIGILFIRTKKSERRKGIAIAMAKELQRLHPEHEISWGGLTPDGSKFLPKLPRTYTENPRYNEITKRLAHLRKKIVALDSIFDRWHNLYDTNKVEAEKQRGRLKSYQDMYQRTSDEIWNLEQELIPMSAGNWKVNP